MKPYIYGREREAERIWEERKGRGKSCAMEPGPSWWHLKTNITARETISK